MQFQGANGTPHAPDEALAIIGMACRFPGGAQDVDAYWQLVRDGVDAIVEVPSDRWDVGRFYDPDPGRPGRSHVRHGGFLREGLTAFDPAFFGIPPREAAILDPQQRLLLKVAYEAIEDAGAPLTRLRGTRVGVYVGAFTLDNLIQRLAPAAREVISAHTAASAGMTMLANRISYHFDLTGPSLTVDTACSSSLVAFHLACQAVWRGECEMALAGGVNAMFRPEYFVAMSKGGFLSPQGRCLTFDSRANGYGRGEGAGVVVVKPYRHALADGDRIYARVLATGVNQDGRSQGLTVPNGASQEALARAVCQRAGLSPRAVDYIEAHGTGTRVGDPIETRSLGGVFGADRSEDARCWVGSVKTNIGHLEGAAGVAGLMRAVLVLNHRAVPPHLHLQTLNPEIDLDALGLRVARSLAPLAAEGTLHAAVNSFGYGGTNAHVVLSSADEPIPAGDTPRAAALGDSRSLAPAPGPVVLPISAQTDRALIRRAEHVAALLREAAPSLSDLAHTLAHRTDAFSQRVAVVGVDAAQLAAQLDEVLRGEAQALARGAVYGDQARRLVFVFTGMGAQSWGMGRELIAREPVVAQAIEDCDRVWTRLAGWSLRERLFERASGGPMVAPEEAQPANFVIQLALSRLWEAYGVRPDAVVGHSVGEITAAHVAGALTLEQTLELVYHRCMLQRDMPTAGGMLAAGLGAKEIEPLLRPWADRISIAAINSARSVTLSGDPVALADVGNLLEKRGAFQRVLQVGCAYHSYQMEHLREPFTSALGGLDPAAPTVPLYSAVLGHRLDEPVQNVGYWWQNLRNTVLFDDAMAAVLDDGFTAFLEVGPHPVLGGAIRECAAERGLDVTLFESLRRGRPEVDTMRSALAKMWTEGVHVDWERLAPSGARVHLPSYPWDEEALWEEPEVIRDDRLGAPGHPLVQRDTRAAEPTWSGELTPSRQPWLPDHAVDDLAIFPAAGSIELALAALREGDGVTVLTDVRFERPLVVDQTPTLQLTFDEAQGRFTVWSRAPHPDAAWSAHASGRLAAHPTRPRCRRVLLDDVGARCANILDVEELYGRLETLGLGYGPRFRGLAAVRVGDGEVLARVEAPSALEPTDEYLAHPALLDASLQALLAAVPDEVGASGYLPVGVREVRVHAPLPRAFYVHGQLLRRGGSAITASVCLCDDDGSPLIELDEVRLRAFTPSRPGARDEREPAALASVWERSPERPEARPADGTWLLFDAGDALLPALRHELTERGARVVTVRPAERFEPDQGRGFGIRRGVGEDVRAMLESIPELRGVVYGWSLQRGANERDAAGIRDAVDLLHLVLDLARRGDVHRLALVTRKAHGVEPTERPDHPGQAAGWGLLRVAAVEHPSLRPVLLDLDDRAPQLLANEACAELLGDSPETDVALRASGRWVNRLVEAQHPAPSVIAAGPSTPFELIVERPGDTATAVWHERTRREPGVGEVEVRADVMRVDAADRLLALDRLGPDARALYADRFGAAAVGVVVRVGDGAGPWQVGDEVVCFGGAGRFRTVAGAQLAPRPGTLSATAAVAALPFVTALHALTEIATLTPTDRILVYADDVDGLAAVQVANGIGAEVIAVAGSEGAREALREVGIARTLAVGDALIDELSARTQSRGVEVVYGRLSEAERRRALHLLAPGGRLVELGPAEEGDATLPRGLFDRNLSFATLDPGRLVTDDPGTLAPLFERVSELLEQGALAPLPVLELHAAEVSAALDALARDPVVVALRLDVEGIPMRPRSRPIVRSDASYLVTGGLGGFGLEIARWLAAQGARHLVLASRRGPQTPGADEIVAELAALGARALPWACDVSDRAEVERMVAEVAQKLPPLRGVVHSAMVLDDGILEELDAARLERVMAPKALGALHLDAATRGADLDFFVAFSSISSLFGNMGQGSYVAANSVLDALAHHRRAGGLPAVTINWGALGGAGVVARDHALEEHLRSIGVRPIAPARATAAFGRLAVSGPAQVGFADVDWNQLVRASATHARSPRLMHLVEATDEQAASLGDRLRASATAERLPLVLEFLSERLAGLLGMSPERLEPEMKLDRLGLDSLAAVELNNTIRVHSGVALSAMFLVRGPSIRELAAAILDGLGPEGDAPR